LGGRGKVRRAGGERREDKKKGEEGRGVQSTLYENGNRSQPGQTGGRDLNCECKKGVKEILKGT